MDSGRLYAAPSARGNHEGNDWSEWLVPLPSLKIARRILMLCSAGPSLLIVVSEDFDDVVRMGIDFVGEP
jgi:hypothetical protein